MPEGKTLFEQRARAWEAYTAILDVAEREGRSFTAEERASLAKAEADIASLTEDIRRYEFARSQGGAIEPVGLPTGDVRGKPEATEEKRHAAAFDSLVRRGITRVSTEDRDVLARYDMRAQGEGTGSAGGFLVPPGYLRRITEVMKAYGGLLGVANVIQTSTGNTLQWPNNDDTANIGSILGENTQVSEVDLTFGTRNLNAWTYTSNLVLASLQVIQDSAFDVEAFITRKLGTRIGRALAAHFMNGTGTNQPLGITNAVTVGTTGATGLAGAPQYVDVVKLIHSVDPAYRNSGNCRFVLSDMALSGLRQLVSAQGIPLWQPSLTEGDPDRLLSYPLVVDQALAVPALNAVSILFGDFTAGYIVRQVEGIQMVTLHERYADFLQVGYFGYARFDGRPDDPNAVKGFKGAAS